MDDSMSKMSEGMVSYISSVDYNRDYKEEAMEDAIDIFNMYFSQNSEHLIKLDNPVRDRLLLKYGIHNVDPTSIKTKIDLSYKEPDENELID